MIINNVGTENPTIIQLGRQGEHDARQIWFDLTWLIENFGSGTALLVNQRSQDSAPYNVTTAQEGTCLIWTIDETDTAYEGFGKCEIRWTVGGLLAKTVIYKTNIQKSITGDAVIPDPYESWYDKMMEQIGDNQQYAQDAQQAASDARGYAQDAEAAKQAVLAASITVTPVTENGNLTFSATLS